MRLALSVLATISILIPGLGSPPRPQQAARPGPDSFGGFRENRGQFPETVLFQAAYPGGILWITPGSLWYSLATGADIRLEFIGAQRGPRVETEGRMPVRASYYRGADPEAWILDAPTWSAVRLRGLYPGIDLEFRMADGYPVAVLRRGDAGGSSGGDPIRVGVSGASIQGETDAPDFGSDSQASPGRLLAVQTGVGEAAIMLPWGEIPWLLEIDEAGGGSRQIPIPAGPAGTAATSHPWTPPAAGGEILYSSYLGGTLWDQADAVGYDSEGRIYLAGYTLSLDFPTAPGLRPLSHNVDAFAARLDPATGGADYLAVFQGGDLLNGEEYVTDLAVDAQGSAYLAGHTNSLDFPTTPGAYDTEPNGGIDAFAVKLAPDGSLAYSTYLGGDNLDLGTGISLAGDGSVVVTGGTFSADFPVTPDALQPSIADLRDIFVTQIAPDGGGLLYSTLYGGGGQDQADDVSLGPDGSIYLTGWTNSADFPTSAGAFAPDPEGGFDAFLVRMALSSPAVEYATYLGGSGEDRGFGVRALPDGTALATGRTNSADFPITPGAGQGLLGGGLCPPDPCPDVYLASLSPGGETLGHATFLGGEGWDAAEDIAIGPGGEVYLTGETHAPDFPVTPGAMDSDLSGGQDAFVARYDLASLVMSYASYLGGDDWDGGSSIAVDGGSRVYLAGKTFSSDFPTTANAYAAIRAGDFDAYGMIQTLPQAERRFLPVVIR